MTFAFTDDQAERFVSAHERIADSLEGIGLVFANIYPMVEHAFNSDFGPLETPPVSPATDGVIWTGPIVTMVVPHACGNNMCRSTQDGEVRCFGCNEVLAHS